MKRKIFSLLAAAALTPVAASTAYDMHAENDANEELRQTSDPAFASEEKLEEGFLTHYLNEAIASGMNHTEAKKDMSYGRHVTDYISAPKFGGYFVGKYSYTNQDGKHTGDGFSQRYTRLYVNGTILRDFAYRIQMQTNNEKFHMKDYFIEWQKYKELRIKVGQYKRAFGFENPMNPWDVGTGDYSQMTKKLAGMNDYIGDEPSTTGGRDQGIQ
ncbi:MAG: porin, partial [Prevotella sp.]|nr:porin [Prevotella sp.]